MAKPITQSPVETPAPTRLHSPIHPTDPPTPIHPRFGRPPRVLSSPARMAALPPPEGAPLRLSHTRQAVLSSRPPRTARPPRPKPCPNPVTRPPPEPTSSLPNPRRPDRPDPSPPPWRSRCDTCDPSSSHSTQLSPACALFSSTWSARPATTKSLP